VVCIIGIFLERKSCTICSLVSLQSEWCSWIEWK